MVDNLYKPANVVPELQPPFDQLQNEFAGKYEIWVRDEDFGRSISAGIVNRSKWIAVIVPFRRGGRDIRNMLTPSEIDMIRNHLTSDAKKDLVF